MANHQISSTVHDRYHGKMKAQELRSQKFEGRLQAAEREEPAKPKLRLYDGFQMVIDDGHARHSHGKTDGKEFQHDKIDHFSRNQTDGRRELVGRNAYGPHKGHFSHGKTGWNHPRVQDTLHGTFTDPEFGKITYNPSPVFSGTHLGSSDKVKDAHQNFLTAALDYIKNPSAQSYKALTESMTKLLDPKFAPAVKDGGVRVEISHVNGTMVAKFTMDITPAATKSLEEAREALKNAYSSKRDGEKDVGDIRAQAYADYIRALSEQFKKQGKIDKTNHTPTTPVFKVPVFHIGKGAQLNLHHLRELKKPDFQHQHHHKHSFSGKLVMKNHQSVWNDYRHNQKSYVDLIKQDKKLHINHHRADDRHDSRRVDERKAGKAGHDHRRADERNDFRRSDTRDTEKSGRSHPKKERAHLA